MENDEQRRFYDKIMEDYIDMKREAVLGYNLDSHLKLCNEYINDINQRIDDDISAGIAVDTFYKLGYHFYYLRDEIENSLRN